MIKTLVYVLGIIAAVWCVLDIFKKNISLVVKVILSVLVLTFSWVGIIVYYFLRNKI